MTSTSSTPPFISTPAPTTTGPVLTTPVVTTPAPTSALTDSQQAQLDALRAGFEDENAETLAAQIAANAANPPATPDVVVTTPAAPVVGVPVAPNDASAPAVDAPTSAAASDLLNKLHLDNTPSVLSTVLDWLKGHGLVIK